MGINVFEIWGLAKIGLFQAEQHYMHDQALHIMIDKRQRTTIKSHKKTSASL